MLTVLGLKNVTLLEGLVSHQILGVMLEASFSPRARALGTPRTPNGGSDVCTEALLKDCWAMLRLPGMGLDPAATNHEPNGKP
jgi:hypothetical protein